MAQLSGPEGISPRSDDEFDELERIPLATRRKWLLLSKQGLSNFDVEFDELENIPLATRRNLFLSSKLGCSVSNGVRSETNRLPLGATRKLLPPIEEVQHTSGVASTGTARRRFMPSSKKRRPESDAVPGETDHLPLTIRRRIFPSSKQGRPKSGLISTESRTTAFE